jgi:hypothetical protein
LQFSPASCFFLHLFLKYSPQHPVLRHPQSVLNFTPIQKNR